MKGSHRRTSGLLAAAAAVAAVSIQQNADAALIIDVRAVSATGGATVGDPKHAFVSAPGDTINLAVFAQIAGTNNTIADDVVQIAGGSFASGFGGLLGNLTALTTAPYNGNGSSNGVQFDFDSDGDLDVGKGGTASTGTGWFGGRDAAPPHALTPVNATTGEIQIATLTFTVSSLGTGFTTINFLPRPGVSNGIALWTQDGNIQNPGSSPFVADGAVTVALVPEPASIGLLAAGSVGLLARRKSARRR